MGGRWKGKAAWLALGPVVAAPLAWWLVMVRGEQAALERALGAATRGRYAEARVVLAAYDRKHPGRGEVAYTLGICESALGRTGEALAAWSRVPEGSPFAGRAALLGAREVLKGHRFAEAEPRLRRALDEPGEAGLEARMTLAHILKLQGRIGEVLDLFREGWERLPEGARLGTLKEFWRLKAEAIPADELRPSLERAAEAAPDDDRVRLGLANVAILGGRFDEADRLLTACESARPGDAAVARARLAWARGTGRPEAALRAARGLPGGALSAAEVLRLRAWLARERGDEAAEREALEGWRTLEGGSEALERLAELAWRGGEAARAELLRRQKAERDRALPRYHELLFGEAPASHAGELGRLAEWLGWRFEARHWYSEAARRERGEPAWLAGLDRVRRQEDEAARLGRETPGLREAELPARPGRADSVEDGPSPSFEAWACLDFRFENGATSGKQLPETMSGGVGLLDYDGDGRLDVYAAQGGPFPPPPGAPCADRLFRNLGGGAFEDVSEAAGLAALPGGYGHGVAVGDVDNDGHPDVLVTRWRSYLLLRNRGDGTFEDVTAAWGLGGDRDWPTSAAFADLDGDGDLDLYVCHYVAWDESDPPRCRDPRHGGAIYCPPVSLRASPDRAYRNEGGRFVDVTDEAGMRAPGGRGLGVVAADLDGDRRTDVFVANDMAANLFFRNLGDFRFEERAALSGLASNADGGYLAGMGVACGDLDRDGRVDLAVTNFYGESARFYHNLGDGQFADHSESVGLLAPSRYLLGFGAAFLDADRDGRLDLLTVNGHVDDLRPQVPHAMPAQLLAGVEGGRLRDVSRRAGPALNVPRLGRGLAVGDLDDDGRLDAVVVDQAGPLAVLRNRTAPSGHWLSIELEGIESNRDGVGTEVVVESGGRRWVAQRFGGGSYLSAGDPRLHFGLGGAGRVERLEVRWPSGRTDVHRDLPVDARYRLREGEPSPRGVGSGPPATARRP